MICYICLLYLLYLAFVIQCFPEEVSGQHRITKINTNNICGTGGFKGSGGH